MPDHLIKKGAKYIAPNSLDNTILKSNCTKQRYEYIPVDFIKCEIIGLNIDHFKQNMNLTQYKTQKESQTDHLYFEKENIKIDCYKSGRIILSGSLHKYANKGFHNYNVFTHQKYLNALERLKIDFAIKPDNLHILQLEYGVNIQPPINTKKILNNLLLHCNKQPDQIKQGYFKDFTHCSYEIKAYDKARQYKLNQQVFRFEIKQKNWSQIRSQTGIKTLNDFNNFDKLRFIDNIISKWNEIIFFDPTMKNVKQYVRYSNPNFWVNISRKQIYKHKNRLSQLNESRGQNVKLQISNEILKSIQGVQNSTIKGKRYCRLTGVDISNQRDKSFLLSHRGLRHLKKTNPKEYERIETIFLSDKWQTSSTDKQIKEIAHNIRLKYHYRHKKYFNQMSIFDNRGVQNSMIKSYPGGCKIQTSYIPGI